MILFRADASASVGAGHLTRCIALAQALVARGEAVHFAIRQGDGKARDLVAQYAMPYDVIGADKDDAETTRAIAAGLPPLRFIVVDHYALDVAWERAVASYAQGLLAIDDLGRSHACTLLLDQNFAGDDDLGYTSRIPSAARQLIGPRYALLRPEFHRLREQRRPVATPLRRVLVSFGGSDPTNEAVKVIQALRTVPGDLSVRIVAGPLNPRTDALIREAAGDDRVTVAAAITDMAAVLAGIDLAIGAVGASTWERFCLGVPSLLVTVAANQQPAAARLATAGYIRLLGHGPELTPADYAAVLTAALADPGPLVAQARRAAGLVDGRGAERVAAVMLGETEP